MESREIRGICISSRLEKDYLTVRDYILRLTPDVEVIPFTTVLKDITLLEKCDFIFTIGGDGSVAWVVREFFSHYSRVDLLKPIVPIIRPSSVGYLMQMKFAEREFLKGYQHIIDGKYTIVNRTVLSTTVGKRRFIAVNEIFISCSPRLAVFSLKMPNVGSTVTPMTNTMADGVMVVSAIGSTGWSLSHQGMINLNEDTLQIMFVGGIHSAANFVVPRQPIKIEINLKNSPITEETIQAYQDQRKIRGIPEDYDAEETLDILFGTKVIIDGKVEGFGITEIEVDSSLEVPFVFMQKETNMDKARKLTEQPNIKRLSY